ncbi:MAG: serine protease [Bdellovibrionota bacterium]
MIILLLLSLQAFATTPDVIYGEDNRRDIYEETNPKYIQYARATAAKVPTIFMRQVGKEFVFRTMTLVDRGICASERFTTQTTVSMCSGFLVGPKTFVTAGHCIRNANDCKNFRWVFDFAVTSRDQQKVTVPKESVFSCKKVISQIFTDENDYAVIELDREAKGRTPLTFRKSGTVSPGTPLVVIGNPSGLPTKIADGASVRHLDTNWFTANLDTFAGNSGSAVINTESGEVEGILVRGEEDYVDTENGCKVAKRCLDNECRGEDVNFLPDVIKQL